MSATSKTRRRLHLSTYFVFLLPLAILAVVNCGGDYTAEQAVKFGWPWTYCDMILLTTEETHVPIFIRWSYFQHNILAKISWTALAGNITVALLIAGALAAGWEWRCRTRSWWKFTLRDGLAAVTVVAIVFAWLHALYHDQRCTRRLEALVDETKISVWVREDIPADWFWKVLRVPTQWWPSIAVHVDFTSVEEVETIPPAAIDLLGEFRSLDSLALRDVVLSQPPDPEQLAWLRTLIVTGPNQHVKDYEHLCQAPNLTDVILYNVTLTDDELRQLPGAERLQSLDISTVTNLHGSGLVSFKQLRELRLQHVDFDEPGLATLLALPELRTLSLSYCELVPPEEWEAYRTCPVRKYAVEIDETATAAAVARLRNRGLVLEQSRLDVRRYTAVRTEE